MGRSSPTYRDLLRRLEHDWDDFERALRRQDTGPYSRLWGNATRYADAAGYQNPQEPMDAVFLSMLLAHQRALEDLYDELDVADQAAWSPPADRE
ncbi:hypothetical protein ACOZ4B_14390 [Haloferax prahovense]|uniref:hypothetical protein n=1 Tax=Haloferax prahovense TaxID=381852 RepID=UPI003C721A69